MDNNKNLLRLSYFGEIAREYYDDVSHDGHVAINGMG
jgi:hypothetical protein